MDLMKMAQDALSGGTGNTASPGSGGALAALVPAVLQMLSGNQASGQGGLAGLVNAFSQKGLGDVVQSWVGTGANAPVSANQLQDVLGEGTLQNLAQQAGVSHGEIGGLLSQLLPQVVDHLTPGGQLPQGGDVTADAGSILAKLGFGAG